MTRSCRCASGLECEEEAHRSDHRDRGERKGRPEFLMCSEEKEEATLEKEDINGDSKTPREREGRRGAQRMDTRAPAVQEKRRVQRAGSGCKSQLLAYFVAGFQS